MIIKAIIISWISVLAIKEVVFIRDVGCAHPGCAPYLACIRCPKVRWVHPSKWHFWLRALVPKKTLACIRFRNDPCVHPFSSHWKSTCGCYSACNTSNRDYVAKNIARICNLISRWQDLSWITTSPVGDGWHAVLARLHLGRSLPISSSFPTRLKYFKLTVCMSAITHRQRSNSGQILITTD